MSDRRLLLPDCKNSTNLFARELAERIRDIRDMDTLDTEAKQRTADFGLAAVCAIIYMLDNHRDVKFEEYPNDSTNLDDLKRNGGDVISYIGATYYFNDDFYIDNFFHGVDMSDREAIGKHIMKNMGENTDKSTFSVWWLWAADWKFTGANLEMLIRACYLAVYGKHPDCFDECIQKMINEDNSSAAVQFLGEYVFAFPYDHQIGDVYQSRYSYSIIDMIENMRLLFDNIHTNTVQHASLNDISW